MITRSKSREPRSREPTVPLRPLPFNENIIIDFNEASRSWMKNKIKLGGGEYSYK